MTSTLNRILLRALVLALLGLVAAVGAVQGAAVGSLSTGVGKEERTQPREEYSLRIAFAEARGAYLANVLVEIKDAAGKTVLQTTSRGPWLFVKLPAGDYKITATRTNGEKRAADVTVKETGQTRAYVTW